MSVQLPTPSLPTPDHHDSSRNRIVAGTILIAVGLLVAVIQVFDLDFSGWLLFGGLSLIFLIAGLAIRSFALIIPGGVLGGIGLGIFLMSLPMSDASGTTTGGLFLVGFSLGWALITLLSPITHEGFKWWPLIPGAIIGGIGAVLMVGSFGVQLLTIIGFAWPLILVGIGIYLLVKRGEADNK